MRFSLLDYWFFLRLHFPALAPPRLLEVCLMSGPTALCSPQQSQGSNAKQRHKSQRWSGPSARRHWSLPKVTQQLQVAQKLELLTMAPILTQSQPFWKAMESRKYSRKKGCFEHSAGYYLWLLKWHESVFLARSTYSTFSLSPFSIFVPQMSLSRHFFLPPSMTLIYHKYTYYVSV